MPQQGVGVGWEQWEELSLEVAVLFVGDIECGRKVNIKFCVCVHAHASASGVQMYNVMSFNSFIAAVDQLS